MSEQPIQAVLTWKWGTNSTTGAQEWQARWNDVLYIPHPVGREPTQSGEKWDCRLLANQFGPPSRRGKGVAHAWLVRVVETGPTELPQRFFEQIPLTRAFTPYDQQPAEMLGAL